MRTSYKYYITFIFTMNGELVEDIQRMSSYELLTLEALQPEFKFRLQGYYNQGYKDVRIQSVTVITCTPTILL